MVVSYRYRGLGGHSTPPVTDPRWSNWAAPLLEFLEETPRPWSVLRAWAKRTGYGSNLVRQTIAWAEDQKRAESYYVEGTLFWAIVPSVSSVRLRGGLEGPVGGELDESLVPGTLVVGDGEREGDDDPVVPGIAAPKDEFVGPPFDDGDR